MARSRRDLWTAHLHGRSVATTSSAAPVLARGEKFSGTVLGIDPSLRGTGLAVLHCQGDRRQLLASHTVRIERAADHATCLGRIAGAVRALLDVHPVEHVAVEQAIGAKNVRVALILGQARGAAIAIAGERQIPVFDYLPKRVKQAVCGYGAAPKQQILAQLATLLGTDALRSEDEADAAAVALCHALTWRAPVPA